LARGRQIAEHGALARLLPLMHAKETDELVAAHPELNPKDKAKLRETADLVFETGREKLMEVEAAAWADYLSVPDLRAIVAFQRSKVGRRYDRSTPGVITMTMQSIGQIDFKADVLAAYCKETGKLCAK